MRTGSKADATRQRILDQAVRLISTGGLAGLTLGALAEELRLSKSGLFSHFRSKEALQLEVLRAAERGFVDDVIRPAVQLPRGEPRVLGLIRGWVRWSLSDELPGGCPFVAAAVEVDDEPGPVRDEVVRIQGGWFGVLCKAIAIAMEEKHFLFPGAPEQLTFELQGFLLTFHHQHRLLREPEALGRLEAAVGAWLARARSAQPAQPLNLRSEAPGEAHVQS